MSKSAYEHVRAKVKFEQEILAKSAEQATQHLEGDQRAYVRGVTELSFLLGASTTLEAVADQLEWEDYRKSELRAAWRKAAKDIAKEVPIVGEKYYKNDESPTTTEE